MAEGRGIIAYAVNSADLCAPWRQEVRWRWVPAAVIAIGALLVMDVLEAVASKWRWDSHVSMIFHQGALGFYPRVLVALFLALIVKRCGWLRVVVGIAVAGLLIAATFLKRPTIFHDNTLHAATLAGGFLGVALIWHIKRGRKLMPLVAFVALISVSLGLLSMVILDALVLWPDKVHVPVGENFEHTWSESQLRYVFVALAWLGVTPMKANQQNGRTLLLPMIATVMVSLTALAYPTYLRPRLFLLALSHPSDTRILVDYMYEERIAGEIVLQILEKEDWSRGKIAAGPRVDAFDFPAYAIRMVPNDAPTAQRLAKLLAANPYQRLARGAALRLGRFKQYEAAPILLRFALFEGDEACLEGLKAMGIPQAFWAGEMGAGSTLEDLHALPRGHFPRIPAAVCDEMDTIVERYVKSSEASRNKM